MRGYLRTEERLAVAALEDPVREQIRDGIEVGGVLQFRVAEHQPANRLLARAHRPVASVRPRQPVTSVSLSAAVMVMCDIGEPVSWAPCQWSSPAGTSAKSPTLITSSLSAVPTLPMPATT